LGVKISIDKRSYDLLMGFLVLD